MNFTYNFEKPFTYDGETHEKLVFDFDKLTGKDMLKVENELRLRGKSTEIPEFSQAFQSILAARAAGVSGDLIEALPAKVFGGVTSKTKLLIMDENVIGDTYEGLTFDFDGITGKALIDADAAIRQTGRLMDAPELSMVYQVTLAARVTGTKREKIEAMSFTKFAAITRRVRNFLLVGLGEVTLQEEQS